VVDGALVATDIVPADAALAATFFGVKESARDKSPRLTLAAPQWADAVAIQLGFGFLAASTRLIIFTGER
jgi:hypothetical protein